MQKQTIPAVCSLPEMKEWIEAAAEQNQGYAHWKLALSYLDGNFGEPSLEKAALHLRAAIRLEIAFAPYCLAQLILSGKVAVEGDETLAGIYETGALLGHLPSMREAARIHMTKSRSNNSDLFVARHILKLAGWNGCKLSAIESRYIEALNIGVNSSRGESLLFAKRASREGNAAATRCYGLMLLHGYASDANEKQGLLLLEEATRKGCNEAALDLYQHFAENPTYTMPVFVTQAFETLLMEGLPEAHYIMANRHLASSEPFATKMAKEHFEKALRYDHAPSCLNLAIMEWDLADSDRCDRAIRLCQKAIKMGMGNSAISYLGFWAQSLIETNKESHPQLLEFIEKAAEQDCFYAVGAAFYYSGAHQTPINEVKKIFWLSAGILDGHTEASRILAINLSSEEKASVKNVALSLQFLEYSALMDSSYSCAILGDMYCDGRDVILKNPTQSASWYHRGAVLGYKYCQSKLSWCYANGFGVTKDLDRAGYWEEISDSGLDFDSSLDHPSFDIPSFASGNDASEYRVIPFPLKKVT